MHSITRSRVRALVVMIAWSLLALPGPAPAAAAGHGVVTMATGKYHACAVRTDSTVWCWGLADKGQVGDGTTGDAEHRRTTPVQVRRGSSPLQGVTKIAGGGQFTCAARTDGTAWCWGDAQVGQLGNDEAGVGAHRTKAVRVQRVGGDALTGVKHITAGDVHACALRTDGSVWCWGFAKYGQLGDGTTGAGMGNVRSGAVRVRLGSGYLRDVVALAAGWEHTCAVRRDGSAWCWGGGSYGQLGDGDWGIGHQRTKPTRVRRGDGFLTRASGIAAGLYHTCVRRTDGTAWCWGLAQYGQVGDGTTGGPTSHVRTKPVQVRRGSGALTGVTGIAAGTYHSCARRSDGSAWCWGPDEQGQLGDGTTGDPTTHVRLRPVRVVRSSGALTRVQKLDGGGDYTCALRTDRTVWCWGANSHGQHGRGTHDEDPHPHPRKVTFP